MSPGEKIMAKNDCRTCHNAQVKTVGPAYVNIAERYKNIPENIEKLAQKGDERRFGRVGHRCDVGPPRPADPRMPKPWSSYILSLDEGTDDGEGSEGAALPRNSAAFRRASWLKPDATVSDREMVPGLVAKVFQAGQRDP